MNERTKALMLIAGATCVAYGLGYIKGQHNAIKTYGKALTTEALVYLAAHDFTRKEFGL